MPAAIFLDWDDTLLCSTFVNSEGLRGINSHNPFQSQFRDLEGAVVNMLTLAKSLGDVYIVTNAQSGWVELSAQRYLPAVVPILENITIYSARSNFEKDFPDAPYKWKLNMFRTVLTKQYGFNLPNCIVSFGDSHVEREAIREATRSHLEALAAAAGGAEVSAGFFKSIKFAERPSVEQLKRELELVIKCLHDVVNHPGELDLALTITQTPSRVAV